MDSRARSIAKAISWQILGLIVTALIGWLYTGSLQQAGGFAVTLQLVGFVIYVVHERAWQAVPWGLERG